MDKILSQQVTLVFGSVKDRGPKIELEARLEGLAIPYPDVDDNSIWYEYLIPLKVASESGNLIKARTICEKMDIDSVD